MNVRTFWQISSPLQKTIFIIYIFSFLIAASTHIRDLAAGGFLPYISKPLWANIYWTALTFADPLAAAVLLISLRKGMVLYALIILSDVIINLYFTISLRGIQGIFNLFMMSQISFLLFLMISWKVMYKLKEE